LQRSAFAGLALVTAGLMGLLSAETVATAHAGRTSVKSYLVAISVGNGSRQLATAPAAQAGRTLVCRGVLGFSTLSIGYDCRHA